MGRKNRDDLRLALATYGRGAAAQRWTPEEDKWLRTNYAIYSAEDLADALGRSTRAVYARAAKLGLRSQASDWSFEELRKALEDPRDAELLKTRTQAAIYRARSRYRPEAHE